MVRMPDPVTPTDRETVVLIARINEHLTDVLLRLNEPAAAVAAASAAVNAVRDGASVPPWRVAELEAKLDGDARQRAPARECRLSATLFAAQRLQRRNRHARVLERPHGDAEAAGAAVLLAAIAHEDASGAQAVHELRQAVAGVHEHEVRLALPVRQPQARQRLV